MERQDKCMDTKKEGSEAAGSRAKEITLGDAVASGARGEDRQYTPDSGRKVGSGIKGIAGRQERAKGCNGKISEFLIKEKRERSSSEEDRERCKRGSLEVEKEEQYARPIETSKMSGKTERELLELLVVQVKEIKDELDLSKDEFKKEKEFHREWAENFEKKFEARLKKIESRIPSENI